MTRLLPARKKPTKGYSTQYEILRICLLVLLSAYGCFSLYEEWGAIKRKPDLSVNTTSTTTTTPPTTISPSNPSSAVTDPPITTQAPDTENLPADQSLIILVQGPKETFRTWKERVLGWSHVDVTLVFGSFDSPIDDNDCTASRKCRTIFIPGTTWTEGRNLLAKAAYQEELERQTKFLYWVFSDDDVVLNCVSLEDEHEATGSSCWEQYLDLLLNQQVRSPVVAMRMSDAQARSAGGKIPNRFVLTDTYDALLNAFRREQVPILLPYANLPKGASWWTSQAIHFKLMWACFPMSAVSPLGLWVSNGEHRPYPKGLAEATISLATNASYGPYTDRVLESQGNKAQFSNWIGPFSSLDEINGNVTANLEAVGDACSPLARRFEDWKSSWG